MSLSAKDRVLESQSRALRKIGDEHVRWRLAVTSEAVGLMIETGHVPRADLERECHW